MIYNIIDCIGNTPMISLKESTGCNIYAKAEFLNPGGSIKDRVAKNMVEQAEKDGFLKPGMTIVEPTSGNTGIGLSLVGVRKGYEVIIVMPENMSEERKKIIQSLGAKLVLTPAKESIGGSVARAQELLQELGDRGFMPQQFENPVNPKIHELTTAEEIWRDTDGKIDIFVASVGTGGTLTGTARGLKAKKADIKIVAVEPATSAVLSGKEPGPHKIQGIGAGFIPKVMDLSLVDEIIPVDNDVAFDTTREVAKTDGLLIGISSGAVLHAAEELAGRPENKDKNIVILMPDSGERYLSTSLFEL